MSETDRAYTPWHLWVVGVVGLLWSAMGALDYVMTQTKNKSYMSNFTPEQLEFFMDFQLGSLQPGRLRFGEVY